MAGSSEAKNATLKSGYGWCRPACADPIQKKSAEIRMWSWDESSSRLLSEGPGGEGRKRHRIHE